MSDDYNDKTPQARYRDMTRKLEERADELLDDMRSMRTHMDDRVFNRHAYHDAIAAPAHDDVDPDDAEVEEHRPVKANPHLKRVAKLAMQARRDAREARRHNLPPAPTHPVLAYTLENRGRIWGAHNQAMLIHEFDLLHGCPARKRWGKSAPDGGGARASAVACEWAGHIKNYKHRADV